MELDLFGVVFTFFVLLIMYIVYQYAYAPYQVFTQNGIKGPTPAPIFGNYLQLAKLGQMEFEKKYFDKYGPIFGHYVGQIPCFNVTDLDLLKQITVTEFASFQNRIPPMPKIAKNAIIGLFQSRDQDWKRKRQLLTPTFSAAKLKHVVPLMENSVKTLIELMKENVGTGKGFNITRLFLNYSLEILMAAAFGRVTDAQRGNLDSLTKAVMANLLTTPKILPYNVVMSNFSWVDPLLALFIKPNESNEVLVSIALSLIKARRKEGERKNKDLLQLMMDATMDEEEEEENTNTSACPMKNLPKKQIQLTDEQLVQLAVGFFIPGYETTASNLVATTYLLAMNPHVQEKLQTEIDNFYVENPEATLYQAALDIKYLDMVVQESLRLYPVAPRTLRLCNKTTTIGGIVFPEGCKVYIPIYLIHKDPKNWQDPDKFDPMRFTPEEKAKRPALSHSPFGFGQRNCIAMRFALLEVKVTLIELIKRFTFIKASETEDVDLLKPSYNGATIYFKQGVWLKIVDR